MRAPTWFSAGDARLALSRGREVKYAAELHAVIDRALERIQPEKTVVPSYAESRPQRTISS
jgi:hypothetical protein